LLGAQQPRLLGTVPVGQQNSCFPDVKTAAFEQQTSMPPRLAQTLPSGQQPAPQQTCLSLQQCLSGPGQHFSSLLQQSSPQHASPFLQQCWWGAGQHVSVLSQQLREQTVVPFGHLQTPFVHTLSGGQQPPAQQVPAASQQSILLSLAQHLGRVLGQQIAGSLNVGALPAGGKAWHSLSPSVQQSDRRGSAQYSPFWQHLWPQRVGHSGTQTSPGSPLPQRVSFGQQIFSHGGRPGPPARAHLQQIWLAVQQSR